MKVVLAGLAVATAAAAMAAAPTASAQTSLTFQPGWYVTLDAGRADTTAQHDYSQSVFDTLNSMGATYTHSGSTTDTAYALAVGYQFTEYWGFELGYSHFGTAYEDIHGTGQWSGNLHDDMQATGFTLMLVGTAPITSHFAFVGKFGIIRSHVAFNNSGRIDGPGGSVYAPNTETSQSVNFGYSLGLAWRFNEHFDIHGGWTQYRDVGSAKSGGSDNVNFTFVGVRFAF